MAYTPDASNPLQPTDDVKASTAAAEFRALKAALQSAILGALPVFRGWIDGLQLSTAGASTIMTIGAGQATDSTNAVLMSYAGGTKTTAAWAVGSGNGCWARAGAITVTGSVHWYLIRRPDTGVVDVCCSSSATGLVAADYVSGGGNVANAYTQFRRIGSWKTTTSLWQLIRQDGDYFVFDTYAYDLTATNPGSAAVTGTTRVPAGLNLRAFGTAMLNTGNDYALISDLASTDRVCDSTNFTIYSNGGSGGYWTCLTNSSAQIRYRLNTGAAVNFIITTHGWVDTRGRNS